MTFLRDIINLNIHGNIYFFKYVLLVILLVTPFFSTLYPPGPRTFPPSSISPLTSCSWVVHISSLASPFPVLNLLLFYTYQLCFLFPVPFPPTHPSSYPLITLHVISISVILFLFYLFSLFVCIGSVVDRHEFVFIFLFIVLIFFFLDKSL